MSILQQHAAVPREPTPAVAPAPIPEQLSAAHQHQPCNSWWIASLTQTTRTTKLNPPNGRITFDSTWLQPSWHLQDSTVCLGSFDSSLEACLFLVLAHHK
jgi:hypothetical protein